MPCEWGPWGRRYALWSGLAPMRWRHPIRAGLVSTKWSGASGAGTPRRRWVQGERSLPASGQAVIRWMALEWGRSPGRARAGGMQRGRAAGPLAKMVLYYKTHLANRRLASPGSGQNPSRSRAGCGQRTCCRRAVPTFGECFNLGLLQHQPNTTGATPEVPGAEPPGSRSLLSDVTVDF